MDDTMSAAEAAQCLGVSPRRIRALWYQGALVGQLTANRLLLDRASVLDAAERERPATRPLSPRNAWTLLLLLGGEKTPWASAPESSRLRALAFGRDAQALAALVRARAKTVRLDGVADAGEYLLRGESVVAAGASLAHRWTELVVDGVIEVYATESAVQPLADRFRLWPDSRGPVIVHAVPDDLEVLVQGRVEMPASVVAVDLLDSNEPRSRKAGEILWAEVVQGWRDKAPPLRARRSGGER